MIEISAKRNIPVNIIILGDVELQVAYVHSMIYEKKSHYPEKF